MNPHLYIILLTYWTNCFQKIYQIIKQFLCVNIFIHFKKFF